MADNFQMHHPSTDHSKVDLSELFMEDAHQLEGISASLKRYRKLEELVSEIVATLNIERNRPSIHPELLKIADGWKTRLAKLGADQ